MRAKFVGEHDFAEHYARNNKAKGRKNLRCFPDCRPSGHVKTGYCGRPVVCEITYDSADVEGVDLMAFCEFRPVNDNNTLNRVRVGHSYPLTEIHGNTAGENRDRWFPGAILKSAPSDSLTTQTRTFAFNQSNQGWHYAWQSHKMTRNTKHELHIFILAQAKESPSGVTCVCELSSPLFDIQCRRKRRSPTKAAKCVAKFGDENIQTVPPHAMAGFKRSASEMSSFAGDQDRAYSPKQSATQPPMLGSIMPSNTIAHQRDRLSTLLQIKPESPEIKDAPALPGWQQLVSESSQRDQYLLLIEQMEAAAAATRTQLAMKFPQLPSFPVSPTSVGVGIASNGESKAGDVEESSSGALALLAMCC
jgi:hypothetical protein